MTTRVPTSCLVCRMPTTNGKRCPGCERVYQRMRNSTAKRMHYIDPTYKAMVPMGMCAICRIAPANTRDHIVMLRDGGTNAFENIRFVCSACNSARNK